MSGSGATAPLTGALDVVTPIERAFRLVGRGRGLVVLAVVLLVAAGTATVLLWGIRCFVVQTPSMGTAAPVGTLVVDVPVTVDRLEPGDVISFHPPGVVGTTYTHRVVGIADGLVRTRGDINGAPDPWRVSGAEVVGRAVALIPGVGWIVKALPMLLIGGGAVWAVTLLVRAPALRSGLRVLGGAVLTSAAIVVLKPLAAVEVLTTARADGGTVITFVSTGLLPVAVRTTGASDVVRLSTGEVGHLLVGRGTGMGAFRILADVAPDPVQWAVLAVVCALPMLWVLAFGLADGEAEHS